MAAKKTSAKLVPVSAELVDTSGPSSNARLDLEDAIARPRIEVVTDTEKRHEEQLNNEAKPPESFFKTAPIVEPPLAPGATVACKTLLGFLAAFGELIPKDANYPILSSSKMTFKPGEDARLFLEAGSTNVWTVVAIKAAGETDKGFTAMLPIERSKNVLKSLQSEYKNAVVGVTEEGVCLGPNMVPYGGRIEDFPSQPVLREAEARAAIPAFYLKEICSRVLAAKSKDPNEPALHGVLLDFEPWESDGQMRILCTAVATDGSRMHILRLPRMLVEPTNERTTLPPTVTVPEGFFRYLLAIVNREWSAFEFGEEQVTARGEDYLVAAKATMYGRSSMKSVSEWRSVNVDYQGSWIVDRVELERIVKSAARSVKGKDIRIRVDSIRDKLEVSSLGEDGSRFRESISARRCEGPPTVDVTVDERFLSDAIKACQSGLVRLGFTHDLNEQQAAPIVIRGEDEQFKALVMPKAR